MSLPLEFKQLGQSFLVINSPQLVAKEWYPLLLAQVGLANIWGGYFDTVKIDDVRALKLWHSQKGGEEGRFALIASLFFTREAQTALLKITEEPNTDTNLIIVISNEHDLLPTLRSRLVKLTEASVLTSDNNRARQFLKSSPATRLENQTKFVDLEADNHRQLLIDLIIDLQPLVAANITAVGVVTKALGYAKTPGLSAKNTYEYLATVLPVLVKK